MEKKEINYANIHRTKLVDPDSLFLHLKNPNDEKKYLESTFRAKPFDTTPEDEFSGNYGVEFKDPGIIHKSL